MKKTLDKIHVRTLFFIAIALTTFVPLVITPIIQYKTSSDIITNKINNVTVEKLEQIDIRMGDIIDDLIVASNVVVLDNVIQDLLGTEDITFFDRQKITEQMHIMEAANLYPYNVMTTIIELDGDVYTTADTSQVEFPIFESDQWFVDTINNNGFFLWRAPVESIIDDDVSVDTILLSRVIKSNTGVEKGVFVLNVYIERKLNHILEPTVGLEREELYIINESGDILLTSNETLKFYDKNWFQSLTEATNLEVNRDGEELIVNSKNLSKTKWRLIQVIPKSSIYRENNEFLLQTLLVNGIILIITWIIAFYFANAFTKPVRLLSAIMEKAGEEGFKNKADIGGNHEITVLNDSYNNMINQINKLIIDIQKEADEKQKRHFEALQAQINPHFLLNTLNGIKWLCVIEGAKNAEKMLLSLGQLLENMYFKNEDVVSLGEELKLLKSYVEIQKMRYGSGFTVNYKVSGEFMSTKVPVLLLQPLVENAIIHGISEIDEKGIIEIDAYKDAYMYIVVSDNGIGMGKEQKDNLKHKKRDKYSSIGVQNVYERIKLYYGSECDLIIESTVGVGTKIILKIKDTIEKR